MMSQGPAVDTWAPSAEIWHLTLLVNWSRQVSWLMTKKKEGSIQFDFLSMLRSLGSMSVTMTKILDQALTNFACFPPVAFYPLNSILGSAMSRFREHESCMTQFSSELNYQYDTWYDSEFQDIRGECSCWTPRECSLVHRSLLYEERSLSNPLLFGYLVLKNNLGSEIITQARLMTQNTVDNQIQKGWK